MSYTRSAIITGGTLNLGYHAATEIARQHPDWLVVISSRSDKEDSAGKINASLKQKNVVFKSLDLSDAKKVRAFVQDWTAGNNPPIQALLLNAALQFPNKGTVYNDEGIEATFAIAHVGHAILFHGLYPHLADKARVIVTASGVHDPKENAGMPDPIFTTTEALAHPPPDIANGPGTRHYCNAKLANIMWMYALDRRLSQYASDRGITVNAFDPGLMPGSGLAREYPPAFRFAWNKIMPHITPVLKAVISSNIHKPSESGVSLARVAISKDVEGIHGKYFEGRKERNSSVDSYNEKWQEDLWQWTVKYVGGDEATAARLDKLQ